MSYQFRKAIRENSSVLIALAGATGTGKTVSAIRLAHGLAGKNRIVLLDTESGRATHYADQYDFDYAEIKPPFSPQTYRDAIEAAEKAGYGVIVIDSMSHEWAGDGGCQDIQAESLERLAKGDPARMERLTAPAWKDAKLAHKRLMSRLLQCRAHLIFGLRAEQKIRFVKVKGDDGRERTVIEDAGFQPICEKHFMFEMTCSFMLNQQHRPEPIKLPEHFRSFFPVDQPITEKAGELLAAWARGAQPHARGVRVSDQSTGSLAPQEALAPKKTADPVPRPEDAALQRASLMAQIKAEADKRKLPARKRAELWQEHIGTGGPDTADPAALQDLLDAIKKVKIA